MKNLSTAFFYNFISGGELSASAGVTPSPSQLAFRFPVEKTAGLGTGVAIRRSGDIKLSLYDDAGNLVETAEMAFEGAAFFEEFFEAVPLNFIGSLKVESGVGFYLLVLRQEITSNPPNLRFQLTSIPATPVP